MTRWFGLLCCAMAMLAEEKVTVNGKWQVRRNAAGRESQQECMFTQQGNELSGTCMAQGGAAPLKGQVEGNRVTWTYRSDSEGGQVTVVYKGTVDAGKMSGTVLAVEFGIEGEFTATPVK